MAIASTSGFYRRHGILSRQNPLHDNRQLRLGSQPREIFPRWRHRHEMIEHGAGALRQRRCVAFRQAVQVHRCHARRQLEAHAMFAVAHAVDRRIHRDDEHFEAGRLRPPHQLQRCLAHRLQIKLEPAARRAGLRRIFQRHAGLRAQHHAGVLRVGRHRRGASRRRHAPACETPSAPRIWDARSRCPSSVRRVCPPAPPRSTRGRNARASNRFPVPAQRDLVRRSTREVRPRVRIEPLLRQLLIVRNANRMCWRGRHMRQVSAQ